MSVEASGNEKGVFRLTAPGAVAGAEAGVAKPAPLGPGRWLVQVSHSIFLTRSGTGGSPAGFQITPEGEAVVLVVTGGTVTYHARARSALNTVVTFTRVSD